MLELTMIEGLSPDNPTQKQKRFDDRGGVIGRDVKAEWALYDPAKVISSQHAKVIFSQGAYYLSDLSVNGVLTEQGQKLRKGEYRLLKLGEVYMIGSYRFEVTGLNTQDDTIPFKEAGLAHILKEDDQAKGLSPLEYVQKQNNPLLEKDALPDFAFSQKPNTLKAFDFMPEPVDFGTQAKAASKEMPIPDMSFLEELEQSKQIQEVEPQEDIMTPMEAEIQTEDHASSIPNETGDEKGKDFTACFCELFNLNPSHFAAIDHQAFEASIRTLFKAMFERYLLEKI